MTSWTATLKQWPLPLAGVMALVVLVVAAPAGAQDEELAADLLAEEAIAAAMDSVKTLADRTPPDVADREDIPVDLWQTGISPTKAVLMTPLFPGWGQLYARNSWQATLGFGVEMYFWTNMLVRDRRAVRAKDYGESYDLGDPVRERYRAIADENWEQMRDFAWWSGGVLLIIALDAYVGGHLYNFDQDSVPVPDRWDDAFDGVDDSTPGSGDGPSLVLFQWRKAF